MPQFLSYEALTQSVNIGLTMTNWNGVEVDREEELPINSKSGIPKPITQVILLLTP